MPISPARVAIVTAAGSGIGAACAGELAHRGYRLVLMSRSNSAISLAATFDSAVGMQGSVTSDLDIEALVTLAIDSYGRVDAVVNSTGHAPDSVDYDGTRIDRGEVGHLLDISDADWHLSFDLYLLNVVRMARHVTSHLQKGGGGAIVNISASAAKEPNYAYPTSSTVRSALTGYTKLYSDRYGKDGIRMNNLLPGYLENWEWPESLLDTIPAGRAGSLEEAAKTAAFLLSDDAGYITGQDIVADGGYTR